MYKGNLSSGNKTSKAEKFRNLRVLIFSSRLVTHNITPNSCHCTNSKTDLTVNQESPLLLTNSNLGSWPQLVKPTNYSKYLNTEEIHFESQSDASLKTTTTQPHGKDISETWRASFKVWGRWLTNWHTGWHKRGKGKPENSFKNAYNYRFSKV